MKTYKLGFFKPSGFTSFCNDIKPEIKAYSLDIRDGAYIFRNEHDDIIASYPIVFTVIIEII